MSKKLFTNRIKVVAGYEEVKATLKDPQELLNWIPAVSKVERNNNKYLLTRDVVAINPYEELQVIQNKDNIIYRSTKGNIEYELVFRLSTVEGATLIVENMYITHGDPKIPLTLFIPIIKHAFNMNLNRLKIMLNSNL